MVEQPAANSVALAVAERERPPPPAAESPSGSRPEPKYQTHNKAHHHSPLRNGRRRGQQQRHRRTTDDKEKNNGPDGGGGHRRGRRGAPQAGPRDEPTTTSTSTSRVDPSSEAGENQVSALSVDDDGWCVVVDDAFARPPLSALGTGDASVGGGVYRGMRLSPRCLHLLRLLDNAAYRSDSSSPTEADTDTDGDVRGGAAGSPAEAGGGGDGDDDNSAETETTGGVNARGDGPDGSPSKGGGGEGAEAEADDARGGIDIDPKRNHRRHRRPPQAAPPPRTPSPEKGAPPSASASEPQPLPSNLVRVYGLHRATMLALREVAAMKTTLPPPSPSSKSGGRTEHKDKVRDVGGDNGGGDAASADNGSSAEGDPESSEVRSDDSEQQPRQQQQLNGDESVDEDEEESVRHNEDKGVDDDGEESIKNNDDKGGGGDGPAWYRAQVTLNSLRSIMPVARSIVDNSRPLKSQLVHQLPDFILRELNYNAAGELLKKTKKKRGSSSHGSSKHRVMLLCPPLPAYDVCTEGELREISHQLDLLFGRDAVVRTSAAAPPPPGGDGGAEPPGGMMLRVGPWLDFPPDFARSSLDIFHPGGGGDDGAPAAKFAREMATGVDGALFRPLYDDFRRESARQRGAVDHLRRRITYAMDSSREFRSGRLSVYGSTLSGLSLRGSDVDLSLEVPLLAAAEDRHASGILSREDLDRCVRDTVFGVKRVLQRQGFADVFAVHRARVPVVKGRYCPHRKEQLHKGRWRKQQHPDGEGGGDSVEGSSSVNFDICFQNDRAVVNSTLLREYSDLDERVKILMLAVKMWAKARGVASAADGTLSSYSWMNLVVFYLQCLGFVPNLQSRGLMEATTATAARGGRGGGHQRGGGGGGADGSDGATFLSAEAVVEGGAWIRDNDLEDLSVTALLYGFFTFYSSVFRQSIVAVSIRVGRPTLLKTVFERSRLWRLCIEDPFETHDAPYHHDLGMHIKEVGQPLIERELRDAAVVVRGALTSGGRPRDGGSVTGAVEMVSSLWKTDGTAVDDGRTNGDSGPRRHATRNGIKEGQRQQPKNGKHHPHGTTPAQDPRHGSKSQDGGKRNHGGGRKPGSHSRRGQQHNSGNKTGLQHGEHPGGQNSVSTQQHGPQREHDGGGGETPKRPNSGRGGGGGGRGRSGRGGKGGRGRGGGRGGGGRGHGKGGGHRNGQGSHSGQEGTKQPQPPVEENASSKQ